MFGRGHPRLLGVPKFPLVRAMRPETLSPLNPKPYTAELLTPKPSSRISCVGHALP